MVAYASGDRKLALMETCGLVRLEAKKRASWHDFRMAFAVHERLLKGRTHGGQAWAWGVGKLAIRLVRVDRTSGEGYGDATGLHGTHLRARAGHCEEVTRSAWLEKVLAMELGWPCSRSHGKRGMSSLHGKLQGVYRGGCLLEERFGRVQKKAAS